MDAHPAFLRVQTQLARKQTLLEQFGFLVVDHLLDALVARELPVRLNQGALFVFRISAQEVFVVARRLLRLLDRREQNFRILARQVLSCFGLAWLESHFILLLRVLFFLKSGPRLLLRKGGRIFGMAILMFQFGLLGAVVDVLIQFYAFSITVFRLDFRLLAGS